MQTLSALARASAVDAFREGNGRSVSLHYSHTNGRLSNCPILGIGDPPLFRNFDAQRMKDPQIPARSVVGTGTCQMDI